MSSVINRKVSIIIPIFKAEKYVEKCINSILQQSYNNIEIILVDDGSPDTCPQICDHYSEIDNRVKVIHKDNKGVSAARNTGIKNATGYYVLFVDSDDEIKKEFVEEMVKCIEKNKADLCICGYKKVQDGKVLYEWIPRKDVSEKESVIEMILGSGLNYVWNKLFIKEKIKAYFNEKRSMGEDLEFISRYFEKVNNFSIVDKSMYLYSVDNGNSLTKTRQRMFDSFEIDIDSIKRIADKYIIQEELGIYLMRYILFLIREEQKYKEYKEKASTLLVDKNVDSILSYKQNSIMREIQRRMLVSKCFFPLYCMKLIKK